MLNVALIVLGLICLIAPKAGNPDIFNECAYDCPLQQDACDTASADCENFVLFFQNYDLTSSFSSSGSFYSYALSYCDNNLTGNGTMYGCDNITYVYIDCIAASSCWISTTAYSSNCTTYATVVANFIAISTTQTAMALCSAPWDAYFDSLLGGSYISVDLNYNSENCGSYRRALLQGGMGGVLNGTNSTYNYNWTISYNGSDYFPNGTFYHNGTHFNVTSYAFFEVTMYFFSDSSYHYLLELLSNNWLISAFDSMGYLANTWLFPGCLETECCLNTSNCTMQYDYCNSGGNSSSGNNGSNPSSVMPSVMPSVAPTTSSNFHWSPAASNKPLFVNFLIIGAIVCGWIW